MWFEGSSVADSARRYLFADERGSIVAVSDGSGNVIAVNTYDEYGIPGPGNAGTFQYTGSYLGKATSMASTHDVLFTTGVSAIRLPSDLE